MHGPASHHSPVKEWAVTVKRCRAKSISMHISCLSKPLRLHLYSHEFHSETRSPRFCSHSRISVGTLTSSAWSLGKSLWMKEGESGSFWATRGIKQVDSNLRHHSHPGLCTTVMSMAYLILTWTSQNTPPARQRMTGPGWKVAP